MNKTIFSSDISTDKELIINEGKPITDYKKIIKSDVSQKALEKGELFARCISENIITDFEKTEELFKCGKVSEVDHMVHVSTFIFLNGMIYMTYYANTYTEYENPDYQRARFVYCPADDTENKTFVDIQAVGDSCYDGVVEKVYDTILMQKDKNTLFILWTAQVSGKYYRLYRIFTISDGKLGDVQVNRFKVKDTVNDFSNTGIRSALAENGIPCKKMYSDIGIMQKLSSRIENGVRYYYSGAYSGDFTCIIKSADLITWEYVSQPDFVNNSKWENAVYVRDNKCYYFVRQQDDDKYGFLTYYDLETEKWEKPVLIEDCQSRSDFIEFDGNLYLFHAPIDREHIGIVKVDTKDIAGSEVLLQANMKSSCFYPFVQYDESNSLCMSYTVDRKHIRLSRFDMSKLVQA